MANHPIVHIEFSTQNQKESAGFYSSVFGWKTVEMPEYEYTTYEAEGGPGGGFNPVSEDNPVGTVLVYIDTDDIEASLQKVEECGGKILRHKTEIPGIGWWGEFQDPSGNRLALYTDLQR